jgi:hypothetical protein
MVDSRLPVSLSPMTNVARLDLSELLEITSHVSTSQFYGSSHVFTLPVYCSAVVLYARGTIVYYRCVRLS